ncbi:type II secretion system secretin GspD [Rhizorhabdus dicambivorans]|uniref:Type II secretion system protein GspD n=1 Tax=Rhizorhabdus dicambivorans TaxID=1850238 RepID=A0A2A4FRP4_9SPHN|nr:type II secretion system secretin GspD [Rhizorhabdus dicambivorans]ATE63530.1 type II secretion system protein GspD [Rhizorhabdus dicambivorans]PCE41415.1 type II secretion system protein GspD [Rhizorhabdus dicambivorans]
MYLPARTALSALVAASLVATPVLAQGAAQPADVVVNMRAVEISDVAEQISRITGRTLILDPAVKGTVNVTSAEPLSVDGVWDLFQSVLRVHGFAAVRSGRAWRIIPQATAIRDAGVGGRLSGQDVTTRMIRLQNVSGEQAVRVFRPLVAQFGSIEAMSSPNAIIVTDYAENVRRIESLARALDYGGGGRFDSITLRYANAKDVAAAIQGVFGDGTQTGGPRVVADERSNIVLVRGEPNMVSEARRLASTIDKPGAGVPVTRMIRLNNGDSEAVTDVLRGVLGEQGAVTNPVARAVAGGRARITRQESNARMAASSMSLGSTPSTLGGGAEAPAAAAGDGDGAAKGFSTPELTVQPAPELNAIVLRGTPAAIAEVEPLIAQLDVRRPQVLIEAAIVEISGDEAEQLSVQLGLGAAALNRGDGAATSFTTGPGVSLSTILGAIGAPAAVAVAPNGGSANIGLGDNFSVLVQALGQSTRANLLSTPSLTTLDNEPAEIVVGQNVPFRTGSFATDGNSLNPFTTIERQDVGLTLKVVPRIHQGNVVRLEVAQEVSALVPAVIGAADLITNRRSIQTTVLADDGQTIVLGGLIADDRTLTKSQVPILGDVPVLGELFKSRREAQVKRTLFVFLKPTILRDQAATRAVTEAKYARTRYDEAMLGKHAPLLLEPPRARLPVEISGVY